MGGYRQATFFGDGNTDIRGQSTEGPESNNLVAKEKAKAVQTNDAKWEKRRPPGGLGLRYTFPTAGIGTQKRAEEKD